MIIHLASINVNYDFAYKYKQFCINKALVNNHHNLFGINGIAFAHLASEDVVRHALVGKIVQAYDRHAAIAGDHGRRRHRRNEAPHGPAGRTEEHNGEIAGQNAHDGDENLGTAESKTPTTFPIMRSITTYER